MLLLTVMATSAATSERGADSLCIFGNDMDAGPGPWCVGAPSARHGESGHQDEHSHGSSSSSELPLWDEQFV